MNCWEYLKCGREPGGDEAEKFGVCPAAQSNTFNGVNKGKYAGRFCWAIAGTYCYGETQGTHAKKLQNCIHCKFLKMVHDECDRKFILTIMQANESKE